MNCKRKTVGENQGLEFEDVLLFHVLPNLPAKSLSRFKCVCKKWLRWISDDPAFISELSRRSVASPCMIYTSSSGLGFLSMEGNPIVAPDPSLDFVVDIYASCNGLLCVSVGRSDSNRTIFVCNPMTKEWSLIPGKTRWGRFGLAFNPLDSPHTYKLVCLYMSNQSYSFEFSVFSSSTGVWTESGEKVVYNCDGLFGACVYNGGILYWCSGNRTIWFDPENDLAGIILPPPKVWRRHPHYVLGEWEGKLSSTRVVDRMIETWILTDFKWTRIYRASLDCVIQGFEFGLSSILMTGKGSMLRYQWGDFLYFSRQTDTRSFQIIRCDMRTGEVTKSKSKTYGDNDVCSPFYLYNKKFVRLPKLSNM